MLFFSIYVCYMLYNVSHFSLCKQESYVTKFLTENRGKHIGEIPRAVKEKDELLQKLIEGLEVIRDDSD